MDIDPGRDEQVARALLSLQRGAYAAEAAMIGDDRIPQLREPLDALRRAPLRWLGAVQEAPIQPGTDRPRLIGAIGWSETPPEVNIARLVVDPDSHRRGAGRALVQAVLARAGRRPTVVSTGRANIPARALYETLGFALVREREAIPGLWVTEYAHAAVP